MTFRTINLYQQGVERRQRNEWREQIALAHLNAKLVLTAFHNPKKFPRLQELLPSDPLKVLNETPKERRARILRRMKQLQKTFGGTIKGLENG